MAYVHAAGRWVDIHVEYAPAQGPFGTREEAAASAASYFSLNDDERTELAKKRAVYFIGDRRVAVGCDLVVLNEV